MAKALTVKEPQARKLLTGLGEKKAKSAAPAKLEKMLAALTDKIEELDSDLLEALDKGSQKLLEKVASAGKISVEADTDDEEEDESDEKPAKGKKASAKAAKNGKPKKDGEVSTKTQQGHAITEVINKATGPMSADDIHKKASKKVSMSLARVEGHMKWMVDGGKATKTKKGLYQPT